MQKLSDTEVARLRRLWAEGRATADLAAMFGISRMHVARLAHEDQRPVIAQLAADRVRNGVGNAVDAFLADLELGPGDEVLAATARALGAKLDACAAAESGAAAAAVPRLSAELVELLDRLRTPIRRPDKVDALVQRRTARRLAAAAGTNDHPGASPPH